MPHGVIPAVLLPFDADPFVDMHNRMKEALVLLGKLPRAAIRRALVAAGLIGKDADRDTA